MASRLYDSANRNSSATLTELGTADSGHSWVDLSSQASAVGIINNAFRLDTAAARALAVLDAGALGQDGTLSCRLIGQGAGLGLAFRVVDALNYWRFWQRVYSYTYQSGTETYVSGYNQVFSHYENQVVGYSPTLYLWRKTYVTGVTHNYSDLYGLHHEDMWGSSSTQSPFPGGGIDHLHYLAGSYYPGDQANHSHANGGAYYTGQQQVGGPIYQQVAVYTSQPVYATRPIYATATGYDARLECIVAGTIDTATRVARQVTGPFTGLSVQLAGTSIRAFVAGASEPLVTTDGRHGSATRHGITLGKDTEFLSANTNLIDDFAFNPVAAGSLQPPVLL